MPPAISRTVSLCLLLVASSLGTAGALGQADILSGRPLVPLRTEGGVGPEGPESVVSVSATVRPPRDRQPAMLAVTADIAAPWHTYSITQKPVLAVPTKITLSPSADYRLIGEFRPSLPPEIEEKDGHQFEIHSGTVTWQAPIEIKPGLDPQQLKLAGKVKIQVCSDQSCLQPTDFEFEAVPSANVGGAVADGPAQPSGTFTHPNVHATIRGFVEPQIAAAGGKARLILSAELPPGWHVYELAPSDPGDLGYKPTLVALTNSAGFRLGPTTADQQVTVEEPEAEGLPTLRYYKGLVTWTTEIDIPPDATPGDYPLEGLIGYQTCLDVRCDMPAAAQFRGTISVGQAERPGQVPLAFSEAKYREAAKAAAAYPRQRATADVPAPLTQAPAFSSLPVVLLVSLLGGFVLNFMPCVLPVIGLKILSFAEQAGRSRAQIFALNAWYSLGMIAVFVVLAALASGVSLGLRDTNLGWGEQFSSTSFNITMVAVVFVFALSFLGVWEIPIPGFVGSGAANEVAQKGGAVGAFAKGVLTTILATPCSGPMLGPIFGYTLNEAPAVTFAIFGCIGLGMASPYLLIGSFPSLIRFLPKPGAWMDTFKQMMGFLMLGTIVFFFSFMDRDYLVPTFAMMIGLWAGCWWIGRTSLVENFSRKAKAWAQGAAVAGVVGWAAFTWLTPHESLIPWTSFSQTELARLTGEGKAVMVEFTADWCANCKVNMFFAIETPEVRQALAENQVVPMLADWSKESPEIKQMLESLNRNSIPLLAVFPADKRAPPILLDGLLTKSSIVAALEKVGPSKGPAQLTAAADAR
jgi:thiol:disulfide interchange protein